MALWGCLVTWNKRLYQELLVSLFLGSVPVVLAYGAGGTELLESLIKSLMPAKPLLWYSFLLVVPYFVAVVIDRFIWKKTDSFRARSAFWRSTWREVGTRCMGFGAS